MTKKIDPDVLVLKRCIKALDGSSSVRMLDASLRFLYDRYVYHPAQNVPEHLRQKAQAQK